MQVDPRSKCTASNTKTKDAVSPLVLFTAATEGAVGFTSAAQRRGKNRSIGVAQIRKICLSTKRSEKYVKTLNAETLLTNVKVQHSQNQEGHRSGSIEFKCIVAFVGAWKRRNRAGSQPFLPTTFQCWLTHRSTGPIAACRHLG